MLVYANSLKYRGEGLAEISLNIVSGWLKRHMGYVLRPEQLVANREYSGSRDKASSWLKVSSASDEAERLFSWVLKHPDATVRGRQWITELGLNLSDDTAVFSCVVRTDDLSTMVSEPVRVSRPKIIDYLVTGVGSNSNAMFLDSVPSLSIKTLSEDSESYRSFQYEIERESRDFPLVMVSPVFDDKYLVNLEKLASQLLGLAQVVKVSGNCTSGEMEVRLGRKFSAWSGAINIIGVRRRDGYISNRLLRATDLYAPARVSDENLMRVVGWVTNQTNVPLYRRRIRSEFVSQKFLRLKLAALRDKSVADNTERMSEEVKVALSFAESLEEDKKVLEEEKRELELVQLGLEEQLEEKERDLASKNYEVRALKSQLTQAGARDLIELDLDFMVQMVFDDEPTPERCLNFIKAAYPDRCDVGESALKSAREYSGFKGGKRLLVMLRRLVNEYRDRVLEGGDSVAKNVFTASEYAAQESEVVMSNKEYKRHRIFDINGRKIEMTRHLKIGVANDESRMIRVYFSLDSDAGKILIGHCGQHLPIPSF